MNIDYGMGAFVDDFLNLICVLNFACIVIIVKILLKIFQVMPMQPNAHTPIRDI